MTNLRIIGLQVENIKRLVAVEIKPRSNVVVISGKNAQGKSSLLDSIFWALGGKKQHQSVPIRRGENSAIIRLDLGEIIITRRFKKDAEGEVTTGVIVESAKGARFSSPQQMLDELLGTLCMDPLAFARMSETPEGRRQQYRELQRFVPGYNFEEQDGLNKADDERRADINKLWKQSQAAAELIHVPEDTPDEEEDETALVKKLTEAGQQNALNAKRRENRKAAESRLNSLKDDLYGADDRQAAAIADAQRAAAEIVERLQAQIRAEEEALAKRVAQIEQDETARRAAVVHEIAEFEQRFAAAEPIPEDTDVGVIGQNIEAARKTNILVRRKLEQSKHLVTAHNYEQESIALTERMRARQHAKEAAIAAAQMPVPGLGFGDCEILLNGLPFDQASDAERLRTSMAIAIAQEPKLRVARIREGSLLDSDGMKIVEEMAADHDFQVWVEFVTDGEPMGFVIEDGRVKDAGQ